MTTALYDTDFYQWTVQQASMLRNEEYAELDIANLVEEIEAMGRSQKRELRTRSRVLLTHLLKLALQPTGNPVRGWRLTIREQRRELAGELADSPSLWSQFIDQLPEVYAAACEDAAEAMEVDIAVLPVQCPWKVEQILDLNWLPATL
jgi:Domain of unknown function DUF29